MVPQAVENPRPDSDQRVQLYLDESGSHKGWSEHEVGKRYLGLLGVGFVPEGYKRFCASLEKVKQDHLAFDPANPPVLHREDILYKRGAFRVLHDETKRRSFDRALLDLVDSTNCRIIAVVVDKMHHASCKSRRPSDPYHYAFLMMLERYAGALRMRGRTGKVIAEARGRADDRLLRLWHEQVCRTGSNFHKGDFFSVLHPKLAIYPKSAGVAGLEFADLLAHPLTRDVLAAQRRIPEVPGRFAQQLVEICQPKYNRQIYRDLIDGYGRKLV